MSEHDTLVVRFRRRIGWWNFLRTAVAAVTLWGFLWGTAVVVLRASQGTSIDALLWGAVGVPVAVGVAAWAALRRMPDPSAVRALLDRHGDCGGLLMAGAERDLGRWNERVPVAGLPRLRWRGGRPLGLLAVAAGYLALGFLLPARVAALAGDSSLDVSSEADRLAEQVRVLKEEKVIDPEWAEALADKLEQVRDRSAGRDPAKTLEALDHLNDVVRQAARQAAESAVRKATRLGQVDTAAEALQEAGPALDADAMTGLMAELSALAKKAAADGDEFKEELGSDLTDSVETGKLSPDQLEKLAAAADAARGKVRKSARKLKAAKLIDTDDLAEGDGEGDPKGLAEFLKKSGCKSGLCEAMGNTPGRGGVNEGPGTAGMQFGDRSSEQGVKFREEALPPAGLAAMKESLSAGVSVVAPRQEQTGEPVAAGALRGAAGGGSANTAPVLPQHRAAVERYFERK